MAPPRANYRRKSWQGFRQDRSNQRIDHVRVFDERAIREIGFDRAPNVLGCRLT